MKYILIGGDGLYYKSAKNATTMLLDLPVEVRSLGDGSPKANRQIFAILTTGVVKNKIMWMALGLDYMCVYR